MKSNIYFIIAILLFAFNAFGQTNSINFNDYRKLESKGELPDDILLSCKEYFLSHIEEINNIKDKDKRKEKENYTSAMSKNIYNILLSGRVLFNDPVSVYLNKIFDNIKESNPGKFDNVKIFLLRSPSVNASATDHGIIFINIGLMAYIENEAQLAFVLCHELSHIVNKDNLESFIEKKKILEGKGIYGSSSFDEKIDIFFSHNKTIEFSADSNAIQFYANCNYDTSEIYNSFNMIHYSYLPFKNDSVSLNFFNSNDFRIPKIYFKKSIKDISNLQDYKDDYHTHPNIYERKKNAKKVLKSISSEGKDLFKIDQQDLLTIRNLARFEVVRLQLLNKDYTDAIYNAYSLLNEFPENKYLEITIGKALYGLSKYRNSDEYQLVTRSYSRVEGQSQQFHYLIRQLSKNQLNVIAIKYLKNLTDKYDDKTIISLRDDLVLDLIYFHNINLSKFNDTPITYSLSDEYKVGELNNSELAKAQKEVADFYLNAFCREKKDTGFIALFERMEKISARIKNEEDLPYADRQKIIESKEQNIRKNGIHVNEGKCVILDPIYINFDEDDEINIIEDEDAKNKIDIIIKEKIQKENIPCDFIRSVDFKAEEINKYNNWCTYMELIEELLTKKKCNLLPISNEFEKLSRQENVNMVCITGNYKLSRKNYYFIHFYNLQTGKLVYKNFSNSLKSSLTKDISLIKN